MNSYCCVFLIDPTPFFLYLTCHVRSPQGFQPEDDAAVGLPPPLPPAHLPPQQEEGPPPHWSESRNRPPPEWPTPEEVLAYGRGGESFPGEEEEEEEEEDPPVGTAGQERGEKAFVIMVCPRKDT